MLDFRARTEPFVSGELNGENDHLRRGEVNGALRAATLLAFEHRALGRFRGVGMLAAAACLLAPLATGHLALVRSEPGVECKAGSSANNGEQHNGQ